MLSSKFFFSKINVHEILSLIYKRQERIIKLRTNNTHTKLQSNMGFAFFVSTMVNKQVKAMRSLFERQFLTFLITLRENK